METFLEIRCFWRVAALTIFNFKPARLQSMLAHCRSPICRRSIFSVTLALLTGMEMAPFCQTSVHTNSSCETVMAIRFLRNIGFPGDHVSALVLLTHRHLRNDPLI